MAVVQYRMVGKGNYVKKTQNIYTADQRICFFFCLQLIYIITKKAYL